VRRSSRVVVTLAALTALAACVPARHVPVPPSPPSAAREWPSTYVVAMGAARAGRLDSADRALTDFAQRFPGTAETREVPYWRALLKLDSTSVVQNREAVAVRQGDLADTSGLHCTEAATLLRLQQALDARSAALAVPPPTAVVRADDKARDEEMQRLRDDLARANAALERIKRRLARPKP
jgi:hypothetical protein